MLDLDVRDPGEVELIAGPVGKTKLSVWLLGFCEKIREQHAQRVRRPEDENK